MARRNRVKELREALGLSQEDLARKARMSLRTIQRLENGLLKGPRLTTIQPVARVLQVTIDELMSPPDKAAV